MMASVWNGDKTNYTILMGDFHAKVGTRKNAESSVRKGTKKGKC